MPDKQRDSREGKNKYQRDWRAANKDKYKVYEDRRDKERAREASWMRRYKISRAEYNAMHIAQEGLCAICSTDAVGRGHEYLHVDHNHDTGKVRGLLCDKCNRGLGYFKDDGALLLKASEYLSSGD